jgi:hypothetical protein
MVRCAQDGLPEQIIMAVAGGQEFTVTMPVIEPWMPHT